MSDNEKRVQQQAEYALAAEQALRETQSPVPAAAGALGVEMLREFQEAYGQRLLTEQRWLKDLRQYRGQYDVDDEQAIGPRRSKVFVRKTRVKVKTLNARIVDLLFPNGKEQNFSIGPTPKPSIPAQQEQQIVQALGQALGRQPTRQEREKAVREVVKTAAEAMSTTIIDQLAECRYKAVAKQVIHSGNLYGTGVLKAPLVERKVRERFLNQDGQWQIVTEQYTAPFIDFVPLWRFFPDMTATELEDCRYVFERHLLTRAAMRKLAKRKSFDTAKINAYVAANPKGYMSMRQTDAELQMIGNRQAATLKDNGLYEVLERWGWLSAAQLREAGAKVAPEREHEEFFCNVWCLPTGEVIRIAVQPINGVTWPYHLYYFDKDETSIFGDGMAAVLRDDQAMINAVVRMILDHGAVTAGPQLEVDVSLLAETENPREHFPFKVWLRNGERPGSPAVRVIELPNNLQYLQTLHGLFDNNADEVSVVPRYVSGENPTNGAAATASGMSMLMAAQGVTVKDLVVAWDEGVTKPFIRALYRWNMQFSKDNAIKGDFDVVATGSASLMAKEVRAQQLQQFALMLTPEDVPFIKRHQMLEQIADAHDLADVVKTEDEVAAEQNTEQAKQMAEYQKMQGVLSLETMKATVAKLQAEVTRLLADAGRLDATAMESRVEAAYSAMQTGAVAVQNPAAAQGGDEVLRAVGWQDKTAPAVNGPPPGPTPQPAAEALPAGPQVGMHRGMHTMETADNVA